MASQPIFAASTLTFDPRGLATLNADYSPQTAAITQRSQDLSQALAALHEPVEDIPTPDTSTNDLLVETLMQRRYGQSMQGLAQAAVADQPQMAPPAPTGLDHLSGGQTAGFAPSIPAQQADTPQIGEVNFNDLIPNQGAPWRPSPSGSGAAQFDQIINNVSGGSDSNKFELASNLKSQCVDECHPLLERPLPFPGSNKNEFDFHKCLNECLKRNSPNSNPRQTPTPQPSPHPLPWWMLIPRIAPEVVPELIPFLA